MRCQFCNNEIADDSIFCPECGKKQEAKRYICPNCGTPAEEGELFCSECGARIAEEPVPEPIPEEPVREELIPETPKPEKKRNMVPIIAAGAVVLIALALMVRFLFLDKDEPQAGDTAEIVQDADDSEEADELDPSAADYNLEETDELKLQGLVKSSDYGEKMLSWEQGLSFYGRNDSGEEVLLEDVKSAYIAAGGLPEGLLENIGANQSVDMKGRLYISGDKLYMEPYEIQSDGKDLIEEAENQSVLDADYILPESSSRVLTQADIQGLTLQEINYAKNEIYARHGRRFKSQELQSYFDSKSWYNGTIDPDQFGENILSDVERKNADMLSGVEFSMAPNGYQLDAN